MNKNIKIVLILIIVGLGVFFAYPSFSKKPLVVEDQPSAKPVLVSKDDLIYVDTPAIESTVSNPITISGKARGGWYFEASFPVLVTNWEGLVIGEGYATAQGDWMTNDFVPFKTEISYDASKLGSYEYGNLILQKSNASGDPERDDALTIKIKLQ